MHDPYKFTRRDTLRLGAAYAAGGFAGASLSPSGSTTAAIAEAATPVAPKKVAAVVTTYFYGSHADVILGKIMDGWKQDGGPGPALTLEGVYIEQTPDKTDIGREMCKKHGVPLFDTIEKAVTVGGNGIPVDGVLCIAEHGNYPFNAKEQQLYPRKRFFEAITDTFVKHGKVVPVFNDKHLGPVWEDALWTYQRAKALNVPFMAGSSMPVGYRTREIDLPVGSEIEAAVGIGYSGLDIYGIHALEFFQSHVEKRKGAETGVESVRFLKGDDIWRAVDAGAVSRTALDAAFEAVPKTGSPDIRQDKQAGLFLFDYVDGLSGAIFMLSCVQGTSIGIKLKGKEQPIATAFDERTTPRHPHFAYLLKAIERMFHTGKPTYPVERTLLTSGILDRVLTSRAEGSRWIMTPELEIAYKSANYPHAPHVDLLAPPVSG
ncbi:hypothetical protein GC170_16995 [bacterium]|nr:hypothetical protein [bacterium]